MEDTYNISINESEKSLLTGSLLNLKAALIAEQTDYEDVSELLDKIRYERPARQPKREAR